MSFLLLIWFHESAALRSYEDLCDDIISHAQRASQHHNAGNKIEAEKEVVTLTVLSPSGGPYRRRL